MKKSRVGIITFTYGDNYGQRLQNLAMQEFLKEYFDEVYTIKQIPPITSFKQIIKTLFDSERKIKRQRHKNFEQFDRKYIKYHPISISEKNADRFPEKEFDYFVVGSDQVWSPYSPDVNSTMFLTFTSEDKRIAISPSLSCEEIPETKIEQFTSYFKGIHYISTREYKGSELVTQIIGREVPTLLDPTLMHNMTFWDKYSKEPSTPLSTQYCLCYCLGAKNDLKDIKCVCKKLGLKLIDLMSDKKYVTLGPSEFLYMIKNANLVITDSYHGTIFSCIFNVPFLNFMRRGSSVNMNSRFDTLYKKLGIEPRILGDVEDEKIMTMDFETMKKNIENERKIVEHFVSMILGR